MFVFSFSFCADSSKRAYSAVWNCVQAPENNDEDEGGCKFWLQCEKKGNKMGRILCSLEILPEWYAKLNPVGEGRKEPNVSPYLPPPVGRFQWSLNPLKVLNQCVGPRFRKKLWF